MIPENLNLLHQQEEQIRAKCLELVEASGPLGEHLEMIHDAMSMLTVLVRDHQHQDDDELTLQLFGIRMLNIAASALKLALSGYYQVSLHLTRDLLEVVNLLDLFSVDRSKLSAWKTADAKTIEKQFSPLKVRLALESHPEYANQRRGPLYKLLSRYAAHPNYQGFRLIAPGGDGTIGPFVDEGLLTAALVEIAKHLAHATLAFEMLFDEVRPELLPAKAGFLAKLDVYHRKFIAPKTEQSSDASAK